MKRKENSQKIKISNKKKIRSKRKLAFEFGWDLWTFPVSNLYQWIVLIWTLGLAVATFYAFNFQCPIFLASFKTILLTAVYFLLAAGVAKVYIWSEGGQRFLIICLIGLIIGLSHLPAAKSLVLLFNHQTIEQTLSAENSSRKSQIVAGIRQERQELSAWVDNLDQNKRATADSILTQLDISINNLENGNSPNFTNFQGIFGNKLMALEQLDSNLINLDYKGSLLQQARLTNLPLNKYIDNINDDQKIYAFFLVYLLIYLPFIILCLNAIYYDKKYEEVICETIEEEINRRLDIIYPAKARQFTQMAKTKTDELIKFATDTVEAASNAINQAAKKAVK